MIYLKLILHVCFSFCLTGEKPCVPAGKIYYCEHCSKTVSKSTYYDHLAMYGSNSCSTTKDHQELGGFISSNDSTSNTQEILELESWELQTNVNLEEEDMEFFSDTDERLFTDDDDDSYTSDNENVVSW